MKYFFLIISCINISLSFEKKMENHHCSLNLSKNYLTDLPEYFKDEVELIWYPKSEYIIMSHYEIKVGNTLYETFVKLEERKAFDEAYESAKSGMGKGFFRFKLAVTDQELRSIEKYIESNLNKITLQTCVSGVCKIIRKNTSIKIPFPFSHVPSLNALYLTVMKKLGYKKIVKIEYVGESAIRSLIGPEIPGDIMMAGVFTKVGVTLGGFIVWSIHEETGVLEPIIVPLEKIKEKLRYKKN